MAPKPLRELAEAAAGGNPLTPSKRRVEPLGDRVAAPRGQRARLVKERDAARGQVEKLRQQAETLREQRDRGKAAASALAAATPLLSLPDDVSGQKLRQAVNEVKAEAQ